MASKFIKKARRFVEDLLFVTVPVTKASSSNDVRVESQPCDADLTYRSLRRRPKGGPLYPLLDSEPRRPPLPVALPTLYHIDELESLMSKTHALCTEMERNSSEIDDLEQRMNEDNHLFNIR